MELLMKLGRPAISRKCLRASTGSRGRDRPWAVSAGGPSAGQQGGPSSCTRRLSSPCGSLPLADVPPSWPGKAVPVSLGPASVQALFLKQSALESSLRSSTVPQTPTGQRRERGTGKQEVSSTCCSWGRQSRCCVGSAHRCSVSLLRHPEGG